MLVLKEEITTCKWSIYFRYLDGTLRILMPQCVSMATTQKILTISSKYFTEKKRKLIRKSTTLDCETESSHTDVAESKPEK